MLRYVTLCYASTLCYVTLRYVTPVRYVTLRYVTLRYVTLRYVTLRYVTLRYVTLCYVMTVNLRMVPPFATAHAFCASRVGPRNSGLLTAVPAKTKIFLRGL